MASHCRGRPLKAWRYVGVYLPELSLCVGQVRIGRAHQSFWAVWDRVAQAFHEHTVLGHGCVRLAPGRAIVAEPELRLDLHLAEGPGVETVCPSGRAYAWTRKQGGVQATGAVELAGRSRPLRGYAVIDDTAAYYERHTRWRWSAGIGRSVEGRSLAWNLVSGVNDPPAASERTVWVDGEPHEVGPCTFAADLTSVDELRFQAEADRSRREDLVLLRSAYRQPFGTFSGSLPGGLELAEGYGVMEQHEAWW